MSAVVSNNNSASCDPVQDTRYQIDLKQFICETIMRHTKKGPLRPLNNILTDDFYSDDNNYENDCTAAGTSTKPYFEEDCDADLEVLANPYVSDALHALTLAIQYDGSDDEEIGVPFKPIMAHQIFGRRERITGYRNLEINFDILPNSHQLHISIQYEDRLENLLRGEVSDNIFLKLNEWFGHMVKDKHLFEQLKAKENYKTMYGKNIGIFHYTDQHKTSKYLMSYCDINESGFQDFHRRFASLIVFYIDAASLIDTTDSHWTYFYIYKEVILKDTSIGYIPVGFCTAYDFHMAHRARIAQQFILPNFQRKGLGTKLLSAVYSHFKGIENIHYVTVESPCEDFTVMRDRLDLRLLLKHPAFEKRKVLAGYSARMEHAAKHVCKICPPQVMHLYYILRCFYSMDSPEKYEIFMNFLKKKIHMGYKKKLSRIHTHHSQIERVLRIKKVVNDDPKTNRRIQKDASIFIRSIRPQLNFLQHLFNE